VAEAVVSVAGQTVRSDEEGLVSVACEPPCTVEITHAGFVARALQIATPGDELLEIRLEPYSRITEGVVVTASPGLGDEGAPVSLASTVVRPEDNSAAPSTLLDLVEGAPGVAENGQGGLFQVYSIRGVSRQRVSTLVAGMRIVGERRAGVSASFIDPLLMQGAEVLRGPSSTYYGAGALGGVIQVFPARAEGWLVQAGVSTFGRENYQALQWGNPGWSVGVARRSRNNDASPDGVELNDHFTQLSGTLSRYWTRGEQAYELLLLPSVASDVGKSNTDYPQRTTNYPREKHLLVKFAVESERGWRAHVWAHPNQLSTRTLDAGSSLNTVDNEAVDLGATFQHDVRFAPSLSGRYGVDYFGRRGVQAQEQGVDLIDGSTFTAQTLDAEQDELAAFATLEWRPGRTIVQAGARWTYQDQREAQVASRDDTAVTGFVGVMQPLGRQVELTGNVGVGRRFASLGERFFTGTTGRGQVKGNPRLAPERSFNTDLGLRWSGSGFVVSGHLFSLTIEDYIEKIDADGDIQTFVNLTSGRIQGLEIEGVWKPSDAWQVGLTGSTAHGRERGSGTPLADVPSDRVRVKLRYDAERWAATLTYQHRFDKSDPGSGESAIDGADLIDGSFDFAVGGGVRLAVRVTNLLDESYFNSADRKAVGSAGRSFGLGLVWSD